MRCAVFGCNIDNQAKGFDKSIKLFSFPKEKVVRKHWVIACRRADKFNVNNARICSKHFEKVHFERNVRSEFLNCAPTRGRLLKTDAIPTLFLPNKTSFVSTSSRAERVAKRNLTKRCHQELADRHTECIESDGQEESYKEEVFKNTSSTSRSVGTNTESEMLERTDEVLALTKANALLKEDKAALEQLFSSRQIKKLKNPQKRLRWSVEDISQAIPIYSAGPRAYRLLLKKGYPFPAVSTLRAWTKKIQLTPGILTQVIGIINKSALTELERVCVLSFDEMKIRTLYTYDKVNDETLKPYRYVQVFMMRGLIGAWKQPIYFNYDCNVTKSLLLDVIQYVENSGFYVAAVVSDLGGTNRSLHNALNVTPEKPYFSNLSCSHKIYVLADVPHLLKLLRNNFLDHGCVIGGREINKGIIEKLLDITSTSDLRITHKITTHNLTVSGAQRQKVKLAAKLFSHTISQAINRCGTLGLYNADDNWSECALFFKQTNDWFDVLNVRVPESDSRDRVKAFGLALDVQQKILDDMTQTISEMRMKGKSTLMPFQKGIIMTNNSVKLLFEDLKERFDVKYLLTYRLNQDILESFFGVIRAKGGLHDHPDPLEFRCRLRAYILGRNEGALSHDANVEVDETPDAPRHHVEEVLLSGTCFQHLSKNAADDEGLSIAELEDIDDLKYDALEHVAGFISRKMKTPTPVVESTTGAFTWTDQLSEGGLKKPTSQFMLHMQQLEKIFDDVNGASLKITKNFLNNLLELAKKIDCGDDVKRLFFRSRMYFRIKKLNQDLHDNSVSRKRKFNKIIH